SSRSASASRVASRSSAVISRTVWRSASSRTWLPTSFHWKRSAGPVMSMRTFRPPEHCTRTRAFRSTRSSDRAERIPASCVLCVLCGAFAFHLTVRHVFPMLYEHYLDLLDDVEKLMTELRRYRDDDVRESVTALLQRLDLVHREGLVRFVEALRAQDAGPVIDRVIDDDPIVRIVLGLYGLADLGLPPDDDGRAQ